VASSQLQQLKAVLLQQKSCNTHPPLRRSRDPEEAALFYESFEHCSEGARIEHLRWMSLNDLFFLGRYVLHRTHWTGDNPKQGNLSPEHKQKIAKWYYERCVEVQDAPNNHLDVWAREHAKSEVLTYAKIIHDILNDPNETIGIFSHSRPLAKQFLRLIKVEFETNDDLKALFPDILYIDPKRESPKWSVDDGITVKRNSNIKESTVEAWGLIDGQPTSKRFSILHYDDVVARDQISQDMIMKTTQELENSFALTASDPPIMRIIGTPQEIGDTICEYMDNHKFVLRLHPAVTDKGEPVFFSEAKLGDFKNKMSPKVFALQFLLDAKKAQEAHEIGFESSWWQVYRTEPNIKSLNRYILVDPAGRRTDSNSLFALWVCGVGADRKWRILDGVLDNFSLTQRADVLFEMVRKWDPLKVVYEQYAFQADIEHLRDRQDRENFRFIIQEVGGISNKDARIERLIPKYRAGDIVAPERLMYHTRDGKEIDIVKRFKDVEYDKWPFNPKCRDQLDALSRLCDDAEINYVYPRAYGSGDSTGDHWNQNSMQDGGGSWLSG
jgi:hypothetical protein